MLAAWSVHAKHKEGRDFPESRRPREGREVRQLGFVGPRQRGGRCKENSTCHLKGLWLRIGLHACEKIGARTIGKEFTKPS